MSVGLLRVLTLVSYLLLAGGSYGLLARTEPLPVIEPGPPPALRFDQERAYALVEHVATRHPNRVTGTPEDEGAARWVADELRALGLEVTEQRFRTPSAFDPETGEWQRHDGINVVGVHPGATDDVILFGAHRDIVPTTDQGADDNASGTGTLVEIARALTATPHRHTYVFVSFGAEEVGLGGSAHFAEHWPEMSRVRLMVNFDMLGWNGAPSTRIEDWTYLPLDATGLLQGMVARDAGEYSLGGAKTFAKILGLGAEPNSDSGIFVLRGYPAIFFVDDLRAGRPGAPRHCYHSPCDTMEQVSADALGRAGRLAEELVRRVDDGDALAGPRRFLVRGDRIVPEWQVLGLGVLAGLFALAQPAIAFRGARGDGEEIGRGLRRQGIFWVAALGVAVVITLAMYLFGLGGEPSWPALLIGLAIGFLGLAVLLILRWRLPGASPATERLGLSLALAAIFVATGLLVNFLFAAVATLPLLLLTSRVRLQRSWWWRVFDLLLALPAVLWSASLALLALAVGAFGFFPWSWISVAIGLAFFAAVAPLAFALLRGREVSPPSSVSDSPPA